MRNLYDHFWRSMWKSISQVQCLSLWMGCLVVKGCYGGSCDVCCFFKFYLVFFYSFFLFFSVLRLPSLFLSPSRSLFLSVCLYLLFSVCLSRILSLFLSLPFPSTSAFPLLLSSLLNLLYRLFIDLLLPPTLPPYSSLSSHFLLCKNNNKKDVTKNETKQ